MQVFRFGCVLVPMISEHDEPDALSPHDLPPVRTQADLHQVWRHLVGPLGFAVSSLWLMFLTADGRQSGVLPVVEDVPDHPEPADLDGLATLCTHVLDELGAGASVALLRSRPGRHPATAGDRAWAVLTAETFGRRGLLTWPVHLATDHQLSVLSADDLAA